MLVANVIVKCDSSLIEEITNKLNYSRNITVHGADKKNNLIIFVEAETEKEIEEFINYFKSEVSGIIEADISLIASINELEQ